ncbi:MAG: hypothetical protein ACKVT2_00765 [Saprospiraceae bacterium]
MPGTALLFSLWVVADPGVISLTDLYDFVKKIDTKTLFVCLGAAYIIGFTLHFGGSALLKWWGLRIQKFAKKVKPAEQRDNADSGGAEGEFAQKGLQEIPKDKDSEFWALIRETGEKHNGMLERWWSFKALTANLSAYSLISVALLAYKWGATCQIDWLYLSFFFLVLSIIYLIRAEKFNRLLNKDALGVYNALELWNNNQSKDIKEA